MRISDNFYLSEFTKSRTANKLNIHNEPTEGHINNLRVLVHKILQPIRDKYGLIYITSGYRSPELNKAIGGSSTSQHCFGQAADFDCDYSYEVFNYIKEHMLFDQLIWEYGNDLKPDWIHVSYNHGHNRKQALKCFKENGKTKYIEI